MVRQAVRCWIGCIVALLLWGCNLPQPSAVLLNDFGENEIANATGFTLQRKNGIVRIAVKGDSTNSLATYYLVRDTAVAVPADGKKVLVPIKRMVTTSTTHYEPIILLNELPSLVGTCNPERTYNPIICSALAKKQIKGLGDSFTINREQLLELAPDAVLASRYAAADPLIDALEQAGFLILFNQEWQESTLLGRAEWLKFIAAFYDKLPMADSIYASIAANFHQLQSSVADLPEKPKVMSGCGFHGTWYVPGGRSYMADLYLSAGASYAYSSDTHTGSLPLNLETLLSDFSDADYWFGAQENTINEVLAVEPRVAAIKAVKNRLVYNYNRRSGKNGSTDFWEGAVSHPDWLLADVIAVLHPDMLPNHQFVYLQQVTH
ncbi:MAG: ABC transporter substrate-binding protein [Paludibacteraceae bacterium]|nr:ABC transporter substrate-binding protein [Paludibacteraceae bacterium]